MSRFTDHDKLRQEAEARLAERKGEPYDPEKKRARQRLEARREGEGRQEVSSSGMLASFVSRLQHISLRTILIILLALLIAFTLFSGIRQFFTQPESSSQGVDPSQAENAHGETIPEDALVQEPEVLTLPSSIDPVLAEQMLTLAKTDQGMVKIVKNVDAYQSFNASDRTQLFKLAVEEPGATPFVSNLPEQYPAQSTQAYNEQITSGIIPRLYQWDVRWGCKEYSSAPLGLTGCCPTALSMVYMGLTGKTDKSPADMADLAQAMGYVSESNGTVADFLVSAAPDLGLVAFESYVDTSYLSTGLDEGYVYICNVGPGDFTPDGHFIVICGKTSDGRLIINDPYSKSRSEQPWDIETIINQSMGLYAFRQA